MVKKISGDFPAFCPSELWVVEGLLVRRLCGVPKAPVQREHTIIISCWNSIGFTDQNRHQAKKPCKQPRPNGHPLTVPSTPAKCPGQHEGKKCLAWVHRLTKSSSQAKLRIRHVKKGNNTWCYITSDEGGPGQIGHVLFPPGYSHWQTPQVCNKSLTTVQLWCLEMTLG